MLFVHFPITGRSINVNHIEMVKRTTQAGKPVVYVTLQNGHQESFTGEEAEQAAHVFCKAGVHALGPVMVSVVYYASDLPDPLEEASDVFLNKISKYYRGYDG